MKQTLFRERAREPQPYGGPPVTGSQTSLPKAPPDLSKQAHSHWEDYRPGEATASVGKGAPQPDFGKGKSQPDFAKGPQWTSQPDKGGDWKGQGQGQTDWQFKGQTDKGWHSKNEKGWYRQGGQPGKGWSGYETGNTDWGSEEQTQQTGIRGIDFHRGEPFALTSLVGEKGSLPDWPPYDRFKPLRRDRTSRLTQDYRQAGCALHGYCLVPCTTCGDWACSRPVTTDSQTSHPEHICAGCYRPPWSKGKGCQ